MSHPSRAKSVRIKIAEIKPCKLGIKEEFFSFPIREGRLIPQYPLHMATAEDNDFKEFLPAGRRRKDDSNKKPIQVLNDEGDDVEEVPRPDPADERRSMEVSGQLQSSTTAGETQQVADEWKMPNFQVLISTS